MDIFVVSRRSASAALAARFPGAAIVDVTSRAEAPWVRFSPFFPHGSIPVPGHPGWLTSSVEGAWQGLKVFERAGVDRTKLTRETMTGLKRTTRAFGPCLGHDFEGSLIDYATARHRIYLPLYRWVLEKSLVSEVAQLLALTAERDVVLLDYETNENVDDLRTPLSHAGLIKAWLRGTWPAPTT